MRSASNRCGSGIAGAALGNAEAELWRRSFSRDDDIRNAHAVALARLSARPEGKIREPYHLDTKVRPGACLLRGENRWHLHRPRGSGLGYMVVPVTNATVWADATASFTERTGFRLGGSERSAPAPAWVERAP